ncbi:hypothetical protein E1B28_013657 [Marasmius oreades]|uniref:Terpene synthase n=1 Tax=Marasmius oreades TaxID=181124 RepID=A0A9P7UN88_9AGAR|nr:uncharacterized protein E1B28_013657 [Marasmius oreades]KAG7087710.1 hypothetical protein E1B28_013657 [Marasmius oreades]
METIIPTNASCFVLPNLFKITSPVFELRENPLQAQADERAIEWFRRFGACDTETMNQFLSKGRFDILAGLGFPDADLQHLETCTMWLMWGFCLDDFTDSDWQRDPDTVQAEHQNTHAILYDADAPQPTHPWAGMLWDILRRIRATATANNYKRYAACFLSFCQSLRPLSFVRAYLEWSQAEVKQSKNRSLDYLPTVQEYITLRRSTYAGNYFATMIEYAGNFKIPPDAIEDPALVSMSNALIDIMAWTNDLCSLQKEYNNGDYHNLVVIVKHYENCTLQQAVDKVVGLTDRRAKEYMDMKAKLPSFGAEVDREVSQYFKAFENYVQGTIMWCYLCPRYFSGFEAPVERDSLTIKLDMH